MSTTPTELEPLQCEQPGCGVPSGGPCLEGFDDPRECPHSGELLPGESDEPALAKSVAQEPVVPDPPQIPVFSGEALTQAEALDITLCRRAHVIVIGGAADSGKTTLLTSVYESLQEGPIADLQFAGSRTLLGFERRCHRARMASHEADPDTDRTNPAERDALLHLRLQHVDRETQCDLLLTDLPGELFRLIAESADDAHGAEVLRRADHVAVLIDGAKVAAPTERHQAVADARLMLMSALDAGVIDAETPVRLVLTKLDLLAADDGARDFIDHALGELSSRLKPRLPQLAVVEIAARPRYDSGLKHGHGVGDLVAAWFAEARAFAKPLPEEVVETGDREFDRLLTRREAGLG